LELFIYYFKKNIGIKCWSYLRKAFIILFSFLALNNSIEFLSVINNFEKSQNEKELFKDSLLQDYTHSHEILSFPKIVKLVFTETEIKIQTVYQSFVSQNELSSIWHPPKS